jgi:hypothetical protein
MRPRRCATALRATARRRSPAETWVIPL